MSAIQRSVVCSLVLVVAVVGCKRGNGRTDTSAAGVVVATPATPGAPVAVATEVAPGVVLTVQADPGTGLVLVDDKGRAMYVLDTAPTDTNAWKPVTGTPTSTDARVNNSLVGSTTMANGTKQATYNGKPLYYYSGDSASTDRKGQGMKASGATGHLVDTAGNAARSKK